VTNRIYVAESAVNDVAVIDGASKTILERVPVGKNPFGVVVDSSSNLVYVSDSNELSPAISVIDGSSNSVINTFPLPDLASPGNMALDSQLNHLFVVDGINEVVYVLDTSAGSLVATITGGAVPFKGVVGVTVMQPSQSVLVTDVNRNAVFQISEATLAVKSHVISATAPAGIKVDRHTHVIYVAEEGSNSVNAITP
jgi:YVTN family beta-propeller protein